MLVLVRTITSSSKALFEIEVPILTGLSSQGKGVSKSCGGLVELDVRTLTPPVPVQPLLQALDKTKPGSTDILERQLNGEVSDLLN